MTPENAASRLPRLLAMVPWLVNRQGIDVTLAARELGITTEQLTEDLELLFLCGYGPMTDEMIDVQVEGGRIFVGNADTIARPLRLTRPEALALMVSLRALAAVEGVTDTHVVERTLAKLEEAAGAAVGDARGRVVAVLDDASAGETRAVVSDAITRRRRLRLRYLVPSRDEATERDVDPMRLLGLAGRWYLEGWCHRVEDVRLFRLDRIEDVAVLDVDGTPPTGARRRDVGAGIYVPTAADTVVGLRLATGWEWVAEYYPVETRTDSPDGGLQVTLRASDTAWVRRLALRSGGRVVITTPPALAAQVRADAEAALGHYAQPAKDVQSAASEPGEG